MLNRRGFLSFLGAGAAVAIAPKTPIAAPVVAFDEAALRAYIELTHKQAAEEFGRHMDAMAVGQNYLTGLRYYDAGTSDWDYMGISRAQYPGRFA